MQPLAQGLAGRITSEDELGPERLEAIIDVQDELVLGGEMVPAPTPAREAIMSVEE
ncbi:hypothetical protein ACN28S_00530 [Cystobacter fuscus]